MILPPPNCECSLIKGFVLRIFFKWKHFCRQKNEQSRCLIQCDQIWRNFATLAKCYNYFAILLGLVSFWQHTEPTFGYIYDKYWPNFHGYKSQILKNDLAIWSHCKMLILRSSKWRRSKRLHSFFLSFARSLYKITFKAEKSFRETLRNLTQHFNWKQEDTFLSIFSASWHCGHRSHGFSSHQARVGTAN